jgi:hypothetical protein
LRPAVASRTLTPMHINGTVELRSIETIFLQFCTFNQNTVKSLRTHKPFKWIRSVACCNDDQVQVILSFAPYAGAQMLLSYETSDIFYLTLGGWPVTLFPGNVRPAHGLVPYHVKFTA